MTVHVRHARVVLRLPVMPRKFARGDVRNYRRWHCWVEAVKMLAAHYKGGYGPTGSGSTLRARDGERGRALRSRSAR